NNPQVEVPSLRQPLIINLEVQGETARLLVDIGANGDFLSSNFVYTHHIRHNKLKEPMQLQQTVRGSRPRICAIASASIKVGNQEILRKWHVCSLEKYDGILGLPFLEDSDYYIRGKDRKIELRAYGITLDCEKNKLGQKSGKNTKPQMETASAEV